MTNDDLDQILSREEEILPSAGFSARVMDAVRSEAAAPPPIPFPWKRALPGLVAVGLALGAVLVGFAEVVRAALATPPAAMQTPAIQPLLHATLHAGVVQIGLALLVSLAALKLSMRLTAR
jgi:hypothetical protein